MDKERETPKLIENWDARVKIEYKLLWEVLWWDWGVAFILGPKSNLAPLFAMVTALPVSLCKHSSHNILNTLLMNFEVSAGFEWHFWANKCEEIKHSNKSAVVERLMKKCGLVKSTTLKISDRPQEPQIQVTRLCTIIRPQSLIWICYPGQWCFLLVSS